MHDADPPLAPGVVARELAEEHPGLRVRHTACRVDPGPAPELAARLAQLAGRVTGATAMQLRTRPVVQAYRAFFRAVGLDPDVHHVPAEAAVVQRLHDGGFRSRGRVADAVLLAVVESGVALWAFDDGRLDGPPQLRAAVRGERLGEGPEADELPPGRFVLADDRRVLGPLFGLPVGALAAGGRTTRARLVAVAVAGVPELLVEEALWTCAEALAAGGGAR